MSKFDKVAVTSTRAENSCWRAHAVLNWNWTLSSHRFPFKQASKNFEGVLSKHVYREKHCFTKKGCRTMGVWRYGTVYRFIGVSRILGRCTTGYRYYLTLFWNFSIILNIRQILFNLLHVCRNLFYFINPAHNQHFLKSFSQYVHCQRLVQPGFWIRMDTHSFGKPDPDPHYSDKLDPDLEAHLVKIRSCTVLAQNGAVEGLQTSDRRFASLWWSGSCIEEKSRIQIRIKVKRGIRIRVRNPRYSAR